MVPVSAHPKQVFIFNGVPEGPRTGPRITAWLKMSALKRMSMLLGTLKSESASGKPTRCLHVLLNKTERDGMFDGTLGSTMASTGKLLPPQ